MQVTPGGAMEILAILGKEEALRRLELGLAKLVKTRISAGSDSPFGGTEEGGIRNGAGAFFLAKGPLFENVPPGYFQIHPAKMRLTTYK